MLEQRSLGPHRITRWGMASASVLIKHCLRCKARWRSNRSATGNHMFPSLVHAYNAALHSSTGYSPHFLMFGRHPRLAIDAFLGLSPDALSCMDKTEYVRKLRDRLHFAYQKAKEEASKCSAQQKRYYDLNAHSSLLHLGDRVLVQNVGLRRKQKLADR